MPLIKCPICGNKSFMQKKGKNIYFGFCRKCTYPNHSGVQIINSTGIAMEYEILMELFDKDAVY